MLFLCYALLEAVFMIVTKDTNNLAVSTIQFPQLMFILNK